MKISINWLKDYVDINLPLQDVAEILTNTGLEVEERSEFQTVKGGLEGIMIGEVKSVEKHPNADKLVVTQVNIGNGEDLQIICGAPNVATGQKVVVATVGSTLHHVNGEQLKIKKAKIRGVESYGMICAEDEIGIGESHQGIMVLPAETQVGLQAGEFFKIEHDQVFEIGLTPNRSDGHSHIGVARDYAAAMNVLFNAGLEVTWPDIDAFTVDNHDLEIPVTVENARACPRYSGVTISNVTVRESPAWLKNRLNAIGVRPISNIVDVTNYVLHEYGQPLHAFDAEKIKGGKIIVKTMPSGSKFKTLDEVERTLHEEDLMICNAESGMCIGGVFGGIESGVTDATRSIFLESAFFDPTYIRKTSTRHGLRTDAAMHFEKGTDPDVTVTALKRAALLIRELAGGEISSDIVDVYPDPIGPRAIDVSKKHINRLAGTSIPMETIHKIFANLDIVISDESEDKLHVKVPPYRADVTREADVIEEILRIYGYNNVPLPSFLRTNISYGRAVENHLLVNRAADVLVGKGFSEIMNNSITKSSFYSEELKDESKTVFLANSMTAELDMVRTSMLHSGLENIAYNSNRKMDRLRLFEFGKTYHKTTKGFEEKAHLAVFLTGPDVEENWIEPQKPVDYFYLKGMVESVLTRIGIASYNEHEAATTMLQAGYAYNVEGGDLVTFGEVSNELLKKLDIANPVFYADFNWDLILRLAGHQDLRFSSIPKFPSVRRDLALLLDEGVSFSAVKSLALKSAGEILRAVNLFDVYRGSHIEDGKKSYAVSYVFQDHSKTLTDKEIDKRMHRMIETYRSELKATIR